MERLLSKTNIKSGGAGFQSKFGPNTIETKALCDETKILTDFDTETFYPRPNFPRPIPRLFSETKFSDTETTKKLAKVSRPGSLETEMSHSVQKSLKHT